MKRIGQMSVNKIVVLMLVLITVVLSIIFFSMSNPISKFAKFLPDTYWIKNYNNDTTIMNTNNKDVDDLNKVIVFVKTHPIQNRYCKIGKRNYELANDIVKASKLYRVDKYLILSIIMQESSCDISKTTTNNIIKKILLKFTKSSVGLMQIEKATFNDICLSENLKFSDIVSSDSESVKNNIFCGTKILKSKYKNIGTYKTCRGTYKIYKNWEAAVRGYNGWICPSSKLTIKEQSEIDKYVDNVMKRYNNLKNINNIYK